MIQIRRQALRRTNGFSQGTQKVEQNLQPPLYGPLKAMWLDYKVQWNKYVPRTIPQGALSHTHGHTSLKHSSAMTNPKLQHHMNVKGGGYLLSEP